MNKFSLGIISYNEEKNLPKLLETVNSQKNLQKHIYEILLVSDGSIDSTNKIISNFKSKVLIKKYIFKKRKGKYAMINKILSTSKKNNIILCNGDIYLEMNTFEKISKEFDKNISVLTTKAVPVNKKNKFMSKIVEIYWNLHNKICKLQPKGTALMIIKKPQPLLPLTIVDEIQLISRFKRDLKKVKYSEKIKYYNKGSEKLREFISQIRRYHSGHKYILSSTGYMDPTLNKKMCIKIAKEYLNEHPKDWFVLFIFILFQIMGRTLGNLDYLFKKNNPLWKIASSTKDLN